MVQMEQIASHTEGYFSDLVCGWEVVYTQILDGVYMRGGMYKKKKEPCTRCADLQNT